MHPHRRLAAWYFAYFAFIGAFMPYFGLYFQSVGLDAGHIAALMSVGQVVRLLAPTAWGWLADRHGRRGRIIAVTTAVSVASFLLFFLTTDFVGLLLSMLLLHVFWSASLPLMEALTLDHLGAHPERYGRIRLWGSVGFILAVLVIGNMLDRLPISALLSIMLILLLATLAVSIRLPEAAELPLRPPLPLRETLRQRRALVLFAAGFFMTAAHNILYIFYSIHLVEHGYDKTLTGMLWSLGVIAEIGVFMLMPRIALRAGLRTILLVCLAVAAVRFVLIGWGVASLLVLLLAQLMHGITFGAHHAASVSALNRWFPPGQQSRVQALYGSVSHGAGGILGAVVAGELWQRAGGAVTFGAAALLALLGLLLVWRGIPGERQAVAVQ